MHMIVHVHYTCTFANFDSTAYFFDPPQNGSHLYSVGPLQGDPAMQWLHRRSTESFLTRMEQRKRAWSERVMSEEEPPSKLVKSLSDGTCTCTLY